MASESAAKLFARLGSRQTVIGMEDRLFSKLQFNGLTCGDVVEFYGSEGCGKTEMLLHLMIKCIMPDNFRGIAMNGRSMSVVYIDCDYHFNLLRLMSILEQRYCKACQGSNATMVKHSEEFIRKCLERFYIIRCDTIHQLITSLHLLEYSISSNPDIGIMLIDGIGSFYWQDKFSSSSGVDQLCKIVKYLCDEHNLIVLATKSAIRKQFENSRLANKSRLRNDIASNYNSTHSKHMEYMPNVWRKLVKYRYILSKIDSELSGANSYSATYSVVLEHPSSIESAERFIVSEEGVVFI
ncbi:DNA repair protein XRCC2 [Trichoplax sp. H2]|nr:DNA repair protein XRCC2 [Trichoplax sp. H2]|eukprot:RDD46090.1 DNA repair protein XRCC2 [Trichoplax sp. H2]